MKDKNVFQVLDENGKEVTCEVLFVFDSEETKRVILYILTILLMILVIFEYMHLFLILILKIWSLCLLSQIENGKL